MNKKRMNIIGLIALGFLMGIVMVQDAAAGVKVSATVKTPAVRIHVGNTPNVYFGTVKLGVLQVRTLHLYKVNRQDQMIAKRLGEFTGVPARTLLNLRTRGYDWFEIGHWLYLPRPVVRAAMTQPTWQRFLLRDQLAGRRGFDRPPGHRVSHIDPAYYENMDGRDRDFGGRFRDRIDED